MLKIAKLLKQDVSKIVILKKFVFFNKVVTLKKNLSILQKKAGHYRAIYHLHYKKKLEITKSAYNLFLLWLTHKQISLLDALFYYIVSVINLLYNILEASTTQFSIYYLYYKDKHVNNLTQKFDFTVNYLYFLSDLNNLSIAFFYAYNCSICTLKLGFIIIKKNLK